MPTQTETTVLKMLSSIEIPRDAAQRIEALGNEAVTVVCEAALGTYPGLRTKVRSNATALLGRMTHPQAKETLALLINDSQPDVSLRAMRGAGRQKLDAVTGTLGSILRRKDVPPLAAAEALKALIEIDSQKAKDEVRAYEAAAPADVPHRDSPVVRGILSKRA